MHFTISINSTDFKTQKISELISHVVEIKSDFLSDIEIALL